MPIKNAQEPFHRITVQEASEMLKDGAHIIDVRDPHEYQAGHVPGAPLIPVNSVFARREELPEDGKIDPGVRSYCPAPGTMAVMPTLRA